MFRVVRAETDAEEAINNRHQWAVKLTVTYTADDTAAKVFVMREASPDEFGTREFSCVASAVQMHDLPEDNPSSEGPFFRVNEVEVLCRSAVAAEEFIEKVNDAIQDLANNLTAASNLATASDTTIEPQ